MGRFRKNKKNQNKKENKVDRPKRERNDAAGYVVAIRDNANFEAYYKSQNIVAENEWSEFMECLRSPLPVAFRITANSSQGESFLQILKEDFFEKMKDLEALQAQLKSDEKKVISNPSENQEEETPLVPLEPKCLEWYPGGLAYQLNLSRRDIRRCEPYWRLHQCLISETMAGGISRQEAVSMVPPLLMDIQPHHKVLDMCAAPGSKTAQLIEQLHSSKDPIGGAIPGGVVVANDADNKRCYLLTHQAKRLQSPSVMITNHDAAFMPNFFYTTPDGGTGKLKFDRILCDVPCSGDGTLRKNADIWTKWNPVNGCNLHGLQLRIARRGLELLEVGGRMVYSTCSMSPMENESVIQRLLIEAKGSVNLVDVSDQLPGLKYNKGLTQWTIMGRDMAKIASAEDIPKEWTNVYHAHLFPANEKEHHLERCLRILPHQQNTGGFFVAVLQKNSLLPGEALPKDTDEKTNKIDRPKPPQRFKADPKKRPRGFKEEPYYYLNVKGSESSTETNETVAPGDEKTDNTAVWNEISDFFGFSRDHPEASPLNFMSRSNDANSRNIYMTNPLIRDLVHRNQDRMKIINTGVKVVVRADNKGATCQYRLSQEGICTMSPLLSEKRRLKLSQKDMTSLLDKVDPRDIEELSEECQKQCDLMETGSVVLEYEGDPSNKSVPFKVLLVGWKGQKSLNCYVAKTERIHYLRLLRGDTSNHETNKFREARETALKENVEENGDKDEEEMKTEEEVDMKMEEDEIKMEDESAALKEVNSPSPKRAKIES